MCRSNPLCRSNQTPPLNISKIENSFSSQPDANLKINESQPSLSFIFFEGSPASSVSWWQDGQLIDDTYEEIIPGKSRNTMKVESLQREHRHTEFSCSGNNNNRSQALSKSVILDLYCEYFFDTIFQIKAVLSKGLS